jgi:shikimate kinase
MNIVLIGYRGTGKTSVGMALAEKLGRDFYDADDTIERRVGTSISDMVDQDGWAFFRTKEKEAIAELSALDGCVIAAGGGAVLDPENVANMKQSGIVILLEAKTETIFERMREDEKTEQQRPSLTGKDPYEEIREVLAVRRPLYKKAMDFSVDTTSKSIEEVVEEIVRELESKGDG